MYRRRRRTGCFKMMPTDIHEECEQGDGLPELVESVDNMAVEDAAVSTAAEMPVEMREIGVQTLRGNVGAQDQVNVQLQTEVSFEDEHCRLLRRQAKVREDIKKKTKKVEQLLPPRVFIIKNI